METMARKTSDIVHEGVLHKPRQFDERDRPSNSVWASDELNDLKAKLKIAYTKDPSLKLSWSIYKVPPKIRKLNEEAYTPSVVSIGPYHHGDKRLESMQESKVWYLSRFLQRNPNKSLEDYFKALKDREDEIRCCYSETIHMKSHEFVSMVLTDACFIIEFFLAYVGKGENLVQNQWTILYIPFDLVLLENQLPFFILTQLFDELAFPRGFNGEDSFVKITFDVFVKGFLTQIYPNKETHHMFNPGNLIQGLHLCDVLRNCFFPRDPQPKQTPTAMICSHSASQLHETGTEFQADKVSFLTKLWTCFLPRDPQPKQTRTAMICSHSASQLHETGTKFQADKVSFLTKLWTCFLPRDPPPRQPDTPMKWSHSVSQLHEAGMEFRADNRSFLTQLRYSKEVLTIPGIQVNGMTETILRNVIAIEQCHYFPFSSFATDYVKLLDDLINNGKDVEILVEKKIMVNLLGDNNEVASMVNKLCYNVGVTDTNSDYISLKGEMDKFFENPYHKYKAIFVREYWNTPWKKASSIAAVLLLSFTLIQTICSIISLFKN